MTFRGHSRIFRNHISFWPNQAGKVLFLMSYRPSVMAHHRDPINFVYHETEMLYTVSEAPVMPLLSTTLHLKNLLNQKIRTKMPKCLKKPFIWRFFILKEIQIQTYHENIQNWNVSVGFLQPIENLNSLIELFRKTFSDLREFVKAKR